MMNYNRTLNPNHVEAVGHARVLIQSGMRRDTFSLDGYIYELRETTLDFWCLFAREWGGVQFQTIAYFDQYGGALHCTH